MFLAVLFVSGLSFTVKAEPTLVTGVSLSPKSYQPSDFNGFFEKAKQAGNIVSWLETGMTWELQTKLQKS